MPLSQHIRARFAPLVGGGLGVACVLGEIDLVRALQLAGVGSAVVAQPGNPARYSRSTVELIEWIDPWREPDALVARLVEFGRSQPEPPVLYYDGDWDLLLVSRHRERLREAFRFVVADATLVEDLVDKARFQSLAQRLDLPVPPAVALSASAGADVRLRFPLLAKPLTRQHATWRPLAGGKALTVATPSDLEQLRERLAEIELGVLLQELVPGPESRIESYHVYVDAEGRVAGEFTGRKLRTHPPGFGYSTALVITDNRDVRDLGRELCERMGLRGVAKLDFKRDPAGALHLLEVNPRFNLWHHPGALAGVNLPGLVHRDLAGLPRPKPAVARSGVCWCSLAHDRQAARADEISLGAWFRWVGACEAKSGFALDDPLPLPRAAAVRIARRLRPGRS